MAEVVKAIKISPDKTVTEVELNGLRDFQAAVEGYIECVTLKDGSGLFCNEDYRYQFSHDDFNSIATDVCGLGGRPDVMLQGILGPVVIAGPPDRRGDTTDVTDTARRWVKRVAREA